MSGELVGLVMDHGPQDHTAWAVLTVIAEDLRGPMRECALTNDDLERGARLSRSSVKRAVALLVADGWIARQAGPRKGVASTYRLRLDAFPAEPVNNLLERGSHRTPNDEVGSTEGVHTGPLNGVLGSTQTRLGSTQNPPSVSIETPSYGAGAETGGQDDPLPVMVPVRTGPDDDEIRAALETFGITHPSKTLRVELGRALDRGHTASGINAHLRANVDARNCRDLVAVLVRNVRDLPAVVAVVEAPRCGECDENRMRETDDGTPYRCPACHPKAGPAEVAPKAPARRRSQAATERPDPLAVALPAAPLTLAQKRQARLDATLAAM